MSIQGSASKVIGAAGMATKVAQDKFYQQRPHERSEARREQANRRAQDLMQNKDMQRKTRRNFMRDYLSKQPLSFGGTVGDLPKDKQRQIASQYTPAQRKKLMDEVDRASRESKKHG